MIPTNYTYNRLTGEWEHKPKPGSHTGITEDLAMTKIDEVVPRPQDDAADITQKREVVQALNSWLIYQAQAMQNLGHDQATIQELLKTNAEQNQ